MDYVLERKFKEDQKSFYVIRKRFSKDVLLTSRDFNPDDSVAYEKEMEDIKFGLSGWKRFIKSEIVDGDSIFFVGSPIGEFVQKRIISSIASYKKKNARVLVVFPGEDGRIILDKDKKKAVALGWDFIGNGFNVVTSSGLKKAKTIDELLEIVNALSGTTDRFKVQKIKNNPKPNTVSKK